MLRNSLYTFPGMTKRKARLLQRISVITRNRFGQPRKHSNTVLWLAEELLFWAGLAALLAGTGWVAVVGGLSIAASLLLVIRICK